MNTGFCEPLDFKFRRNADGTQLSQKTHTFEVRGDCSFVDIGEIVDHHCLNFLFIIISSFRNIEFCLIKCQLL